MKAHLWSIKLAAAMGLLVASVALAAPDAGGPVDVSGQAQPAQKHHTVVILPSGEQTIELDDAVRGPLDVDAPSLGDHARPRILLGGDALAPSVTAPEYWIGVSCRRLPAFLYEHLDLPRDRGVVVVVVVPTAPAAKAGIAENDILLTANGQPLRDAADVSRAVEAAQAKPVAFELIRKGERKTIEVAPEKNPHWQPKPQQPAAATPPYGELEKIYEWFERNHPGQSIRPQMRFRFMHPGMILPPDSPMHPALPGSMSITIMKQGDEPTQITVTRDKDVWKVDEKGIDQLPEDVRPHVERMLRGLVIGPEMMGPRLDYLPDWTGPRRLREQLPDESALRARIEERMERMNQRLQELQEMIEGLRDENCKGPDQKK